MIKIEKNDIYSTLTTWLYCSLAMLWEAHQQGKDAIINWPQGKSLIDLNDDDKFDICPNMFEWYFLQPKKIGRGHYEGELGSWFDTWTWEVGGWEKTGVGGLYAQGIETIKDCFKKNLIFNEETNRRGQILVDKYNIDFSKTIGLTWRGTDIYLESLNGNQGRKYTPIELYYDWIDKALEAIPDARIACTAEEEGVLEPLFKRYPQAFLIEEFYQAPKGSKHNPERFSPVSGYERGLQPALMVWLFSKCAWLIKNRASTSAVASWISDGEIININHSEILGFPPHQDGVEYKGKIYL